MSSNCAFDFHVASVYKRCSNLTGWILRTFTTRETITMMTLFKSLVLSRLDYASQLWSHHLLKSIYLIEKVQRSFTKHITGIKNKISFQVINYSIVTNYYTHVYIGVL